MFSNYHTHTSFSGDSDTPPRVQIERAIQLSMERLCITDHHDYDSDFQPIDFTLDLASYWEEMVSLREEYKGRIQLEIGIELGLQLHLKSYLEDLVRRYPFDFIIGSSHFADRMDPYDEVFYEGRSQEAAYRSYFEATGKRLLALDCYDVAGHLDYVVRYGPTKNQGYRYGLYADCLEPVLTSLIARGKGIECNTGGYKYGLGEPNPSVDILKKYRQLGGEILTVGSDAHRPAELDYEFPRLKEVLLSCGFRYYTVFHGRKPNFVRIE